MRTALMLVLVALAGCADGSDPSIGDARGEDLLAGDPTTPINNTIAFINGNSGTTVRQTSGGSNISFTSQGCSDGDGVLKVRGHRAVMVELTWSDALHEFDFAFTTSGEPMPRSAEIERGETFVRQVFGEGYAFNGTYTFSVVFPADGVIENVDYHLGVVALVDEADAANDMVDYVRPRTC